METPLYILCPGQGAQAVGMGRAWYQASVDARAVFDEAEQVLGSRLGASLTALCFDGPPEKLNRTDISQPAIYTAGVACWRALLAKWGKGDGEVPIAAVAGLSLGEYTALHLAGAFSFRDGLELVALRGRAMQEAAEAVPSGMLALIGADEAAAQAVCDEARGSGGGSDVLVCANFNAPGQVVLSGSRAALERAAGVAAAKGLRSAPLPVAGAFHSPLMAPAAERLAAALEQTPIKEPRNVVVSNVTGRPHGAGGGRTMADSIRGLLVKQLTSPVRWAESCAWMVEDARSQAGGGRGAEFHELAPGVTLAGLMRRIDKATKVQAHDQP